jgi:gliding motility-associated-like protein
MLRFILAGLLIIAFNLKAISQAPLSVIKVQKISNTDGGLGDILQSQDHFGHWTDTLGDFNGDGYPDMIAGLDMRSNGGACMILYLGADGKVIERHIISKTEGNLKESSINRFGYSVANIGDLDKDGVTDVAVSSVGEKSFAGAVYILFLKKDATVKKSVRIGDNSGGFPFDPYPSDLFGVSVRGIGDINHDGVPDMAVGSNGDATGSRKGAVYIMLMKRNGKVDKCERLYDGKGMKGLLHEGDLFGVSLAPIGDLDQDGVPDIAAGSWAVDNDNRGALWILFLNSDGTLKKSSIIASGKGGFKDYVPVNNGFAVSMGFMGDIDGDGVGDLLVGSHLDSANENYGAFWIIYLERNGTVKGSQKLNKNTHGLEKYITNPIRFGVSVARINDLDHNGIPEVVIGAEWNGDGGYQTGALFVIYLARQLYLDMALKTIEPSEPQCGDSFRISCLIANNSSIAQDSFDVRLQYSGEEQGDTILHVHHRLNPGQSFNFIFNDESRRFAAGTYHFLAIVYCSGDKVKANDTSEADIHVGDFQPRIEITGRNKTLCDGHSLELKLIANAVHWKWSTGATTSSIEVDTPGVYYIKGESISGCIGTDSIEVKRCIIPFINIPNVFSPNGDSINEKFIITGEGIDELDFVIYNRWGERIFETTGLPVIWDGRFKNNICEEGQYVYILRYHLPDRWVNKSGTIYIIR